tara:strand:- start:864 stop:1391 length:528 start_codon:yes stop_codon:yes gene_type:complete
MNELPKYHKSKMISTWKHKGVVYNNFDTLYQHYIETLNCEWCGKVFENTRERHLDHDHSTGAFRLVVCHKCNIHDSYLKYPSGHTKEDKKEYDKKYKEKNKDKIKEYKKEYYKEYNIYNKDKIKEYKKEYRENNIDKIKEQKARKYVCECGATLSESNKARHLKSIKHLSAFNAC